MCGCLSVGEARGGATGVTHCPPSPRPAASSPSTHPRPFPPTHPPNPSPQALENWYGTEIKDKGVVLMVTTAKEGAVTGGEAFIAVRPVGGAGGGGLLSQPFRLALPLAARAHARHTRPSPLPTSPPSRPPHSARPPAPIPRACAPHTHPPPPPLPPPPPRR